MGTETLKDREVKREVRLIHVWGGPLEHREAIVTAGTIVIWWGMMGYPVTTDGWVGDTGRGGKRWRKWRVHPDDLAEIRQEQRLLRAGLSQADAFG